MAFYNRNIFTNINKYQAKILYVILLPSWLACVFIFLSIIYFYYLAPESQKNPSAVSLMLDIVMPWVLAGIALTILGIGISAYFISNQLLGAFQRIMRELDAVINTGKKKHIHARKNDLLAKELLSRVNALIDKLP